MSAAHDTGECRRLERWMSAYVDAELDAVHCLEVEDHLESCRGCAERVATLRATRSSLKRVVKVGAPSSLRERVLQTLAHDASPDGSATLPDERDSHVDELDDDTPSSQHEPVISGSVRPARAEAPPKVIKLRWVMPLAAAATILLVLGAMQLQQQQHDASSVAEATSTASQQVSSLDNLIDELVSQHAHPPQPETTDPDGLRNFGPYIGVNIRKPDFDEVDARYVGARMHPRAAMLQYVLRNRHRMTVYVFDSKRVPVKAKRLSRRSYGANRVYVGRVNGYSVAASERDGIGYALASDLHDDEAAKLALMAARK